MTDIEKAKELIKDVFTHNVLSLYDEETLKKQLDEALAPNISHYSIDNMSFDSSTTDSKLTIDFTIQNIKLTATLSRDECNF